MGINQAHDNPTAVISVEEGLFLIELTENFFIEPYKSKMISGALSPGQSLEFVYSKFNENKSTIWLDMRPIEKENKRKLMEDLIAKLNPGDIVMGEVTYVDDKFAKVDVIDTGVNIIITREELSPNKVLRASDEVFVGEHIQIVYTGTDEHNNAKFSRKYIIKDRYDDSLYSLSLMDLLKTMDIQTKTFIGKVISINDGYFFTELITFSDSDSEVMVNYSSTRSMVRTSWYEQIIGYVTFSLKASTIKLTFHYRMLILGERKGRLTYFLFPPQIFSW